MTVEYDLIVIGGSRAGVDAAVTAAHLNARVALIESQPQMGYGAVYTSSLTQIGRVAKQVQEAHFDDAQKPAQFGIRQTAETPLIDLTGAMQWSQEVVSTCFEQHSPAILASLGVDVINGVGEFFRRPHLGFVVNNRRIRARGYLIATGFRSIIPEIEGLQTAGYLTPETWQQDFAQQFGIADCKQLPKSWVVIGNGAIAIQLAQTLARLNCQVILVVSTSHLLPEEDSEIAALIQGQLEAEGVRILTESLVTQVRNIDEKKWVQAGNQALETDQIMLAIEQQPNLESLNLEGVGVKFNPQGLKLNQKLQTTNSRIYACGFNQDHIARYEANIAVKNVLFAPIFKVDYRGIPCSVISDPQLARVGLTEAQARQRYGKDVMVARQYFKTLDKAQILGETTGFCKIVGRQNGDILGAVIIGQEASELIGVIAFCMRQKLKIKAIADLPYISPTLSEIVQQTALEWQRQSFRHNQRLSNLCENWFNLRRNWSS
jgi:pyruvate/2-oxoglutarate dehydrogenase complex dihydrolipoamide dehydrogenase (E3) component